MRSKGKDICELFGFAPDDTSAIASSNRERNICPFTQSACIKLGHTSTGEHLIYGTCSMVNSKQPGKEEEVITCPKRFYGSNLVLLRRLASSVFPKRPCFRLPVFLQRRNEHILPANYSVLIGQACGKEITLGQTKKLSFDWVVASVESGKMKGLAAIEVQSIDITGNYRENWAYYVGLRPGLERPPDSAHGMNWANVHKRLIPQLLRKTSVLANSSIESPGMFFIAPGAVYSRFQELLGSVPIASAMNRDTITIVRYNLGPQGLQGKRRSLVPLSPVTHTLQDVSTSFLKSSEDLGPRALEDAVMSVLEI